MALKPRSKTLATNTAKLWTTDNDLSPFNTSSIVGWQDDQESFTLINLEHEQQKPLKIQEPPSRPVLKTQPSRIDLGTLPSVRNNTGRLEQMHQISKGSSILGDSPRQLKKNFDSRARTEATPQAQVFYEHPVQVPTFPVRKVITRSRSISSSKLPQRLNPAVIPDPQVLTTWKPIRGKIMGLDPKIIKPEPTSNHSSPRPIKKDLRKIKHLKDSVSYNTEHQEVQNTKVKEEEVPQDPFPRITHNKVPGHCFRLFQSSNLTFSRKTFMGISRIVTQSGPNLAKSMPPEGVYFNTQATSEEKTPVQSLQPQPQPQPASRITFSKLSMTLRRDTVEDSNRSKRHNSPLSVKRISCGEEIGSRTERQKGGAGLIKMPIYGPDKSERKIFEQAALMRLKDKVKRDRNRCKSMVKPIRPRLKWGDYPGDELVVQASGNIESITLTTLHS